MNENVRVYDASGRDRIMLSAWGVMFSELRDFRELIYRLIIRNFTSQFKQSFLGYLWIALPPVATTLVFTLLRQADIVRIPIQTGGMPYALFALVGVTIWGVFTQVVLTATAAISGGGALVSKVYFPREALVLSSVANALIGSAIRGGVVLLSFALLAHAPCWQLVFIPVLLLPMLALALGLGLFFAPVNTMMHDMSRMLEFAFQFGLFLVPSVYPTPLLAEARSHWQVGLFWVHKLNPVSYFIDASRALLETGRFDPSYGLMASCVLGFLVLAAGWRFFHICEPLLAERM